MTYKRQFFSFQMRNFCWHNRMYRRIKNPFITEIIYPPLKFITREKSNGRNIYELLRVSVT